MAAIFTYNFESATSQFKERDLDVFTLSDYKHLVAYAIPQINFLLNN
jgi:orotate phosphoribosyltransferase